MLAQLNTFTRIEFLTNVFNVQCVVKLTKPYLHNTMLVTDEL
jgi:hypothetical protein